MAAPREHWLERDNRHLLTTEPWAGQARFDWTEPDAWGRAATSVGSGGRGAAWFIDDGERAWVLRHYRRGGLPGRLIRRHYLYTGRNRVRSVHEFRLLAQLHRRGLPVPRPVSAYYQRSGPVYRAALIVERLTDTRSLLSLTDPQATPQWRRAGHCIRRFHEAGVEHADLNATNILVRPDSGEIFLIDFDRARLHTHHNRNSPWKRANLARLERGLRKHWPDGAGDPEPQLAALHEGYRRGA